MALWRVWQEAWFPGLPHHVTQRGNRRLATFLNEADYAAYLVLMAEGVGAEQAALLRRDERTGRPLGSAAFVQRLEAKLGRILRKKPPGRKPKTKKEISMVSPEAKEGWGSI